jgi:hypothetical protein
LQADAVSGKVTALTQSTPPEKLIMPRLVSHFLIAPLAWISSSVIAADLPGFRAQEIDPHAGNVVYAVVTADVDGDNRPDVVAVTESRVVWYRNPDWKARVVIADQTDLDNVCIAPLDVDGDGQIDFALGAGWLNGKHLGTLQWLRRSDSLDEKWHVHAIGRESWTHRVRWGDILGSGKPQLIVSPLNKTVGNGVRVLAFEIPANPRTGAWKPTVIDDAQDAMHAHWTGDFDGNGTSDVITAGMHGIFLLARDRGGKIIKTQLGSGAPGEPKAQVTGAGEVKVGKLKGNRSYIATVEPMHGNAVVVYTEPVGGASGKLWDRHVLDDTLKRGHAVWTADIDRDGSDEIVLGHSDKGTGSLAGPGVFVYDAVDDTGTKWEKHAIDNGGIATEDLICEDFNGDGWIDIIAGGRATHNVKLYVNEGGKP